MRVLIVFALFGACFAENLLTTAPLGYSSVVVDNPKPRYEYSSSVQTPTYNNFAHVRSGNEFERNVYNIPAPIVAAPQLIRSAPFYTNDFRSLPATYYVQRNYAPTIALRTSIPAPLPTNIAVKPEFTDFRRTLPFTAPFIANPTTKLVPIQSNFAYQNSVLTPVSYETRPIEQRFLLKSANPELVPATFAAPAIANVVDTVAEPAVVGQGVLATKSQYHTQNELGEATFGHREPFQAHDSIQDAAGNRVGSFSYISPDGRLLRTDYVADQAGYRVASNALPVAEKTETARAAEEPKSRSRRSISIAAPAVSVVRSVPAPWLTSTRSVYVPNTLPLTYSPYVLPQHVGYSPILRSSWSPYLGLSPYALRK